MAKSKPMNVHDAKTHFSKLLKRVMRGEEIIIARAGNPVARLSPLTPGPGSRIAGSARGLISISDDFDAPLPDLESALEQ